MGGFTGLFRNFCDILPAFLMIFQMRFYRKICFFNTGKIVKF